MATLVVLDACTIITLDGCGAFDTVLSLEAYRFLVGPLVLGECAPGSEMALRTHLDARRLNEVAAQQISTSHFLRLLDQFRLGDGETECLVIPHATGCIVATDDAAARRAAPALYGSGGVTGTLGLLREAVRAGAITPAEALAFYRRAKSAGAFLPALAEDFFRS